MRFITPVKHLCHSQLATKSFRYTITSSYLPVRCGKISQHSYSVLAFLFLLFVLWNPGMYVDMLQIAFRVTKAEVSNFNKQRP